MIMNYSKCSINIALILLKNNITKELSFDNDKQAVDIIFNSNKIHPSILKIRNTITAKENTNDNTVGLYGSL